MPRRGPGRAYGGDSIWLAKWLLAKKCSGLQMHLFIGWDNQNGVLVMMNVVSSHHICHLLEVKDDAFDVTYRAKPVVRSIN